MKWQGVLLNDQPNPKVNGKINIPNLSEENDLEEVDITVTVDESSDHSEQLKTFMYNIGRPKIREQLGKYISSLRKEYAEKVILPKKGDDQVNLNFSI